MAFQNMVGKKLSGEIIQYTFTVLYYCEHQGRAAFTAVITFCYVNAPQSVRSLSLTNTEYVMMTISYDEWGVLQVHKHYALPTSLMLGGRNIAVSAMEALQGEA